MPTVAATTKTAPTDYGQWGAAIASLLGAFGNKQNAPSTQLFTPVNLQQGQNQSIQGDLSTLPSINELLDKSNSFQQGQASSMLEKAVPGYQKLAGTLTAQAQKRAENPYALPEDVTANISRLAAERGVSVGTRGQTQDFSALRDLGLESLKYGESNLSGALSALSTITGTAPRVSPMSPMSFFVTPQEENQNRQLTSLQDQASRQGGANATTAAKNFNTTNTWQGLLQSIMYGSKALSGG